MGSKQSEKPPQAEAEVLIKASSYKEKCKAKDHPPVQVRCHVRQIKRTIGRIHGGLCKGIDCYG